MALLLTEEYLPSNVYDGTALAKTEDGYDLAQPWVDFCSAIDDKLDSIGNKVKGFVDAINPFTYVKKIQDWVKRGKDWLSNLTIKGRNVVGWIKDDPVGAAKGIALYGGAALLIWGASQVGPALVGAGKAAVGVIRAVVQGLGFIPGIGQLVRWGVGGIQRLYSFNWQQTDAQIRAAQKQQFKALAGRWGEAMGASIGTLCGFTLGRVAKANAPRLVAMNPNLLAKLRELEYKSWAEPGELWEEAFEELKSTMVATVRASVSVIFMETYVTVRKIIRNVAKFVGLKKIFPWLGKVIENWGQPGQEPWSFARSVEKSIDGIKTDWIQDFTEEFVEAAQDMCAESSIIVSYAL